MGPTGSDGFRRVPTSVLQRVTSETIFSLSRTLQLMMTHPALLFTLLLCTVSSPSMVAAETCPAASVGWTAETMDPTIDYIVSHKVVGSTLHLKFSAQHVDNRWLGFGFAEQNSGHMKGSDLVTASVTTAGQVQVEDRYALFAPSAYTESNGPSFPTLTATKDVHQDYTILHGKVDAGRIEIYVTRPLDTNDEQDRAVVAGRRRVVWAHGTGSVGYHGNNRGVAMVEFMAGGSQREFPTYDGSWIRRFSNYTIPAATTTYACQAFSFPTTSDKYIVAVKPVYNEATKKYPHHAILHVCQQNTYWNDHQMPRLCGGNGDSPLGDTNSECSSLMWSWAVGLGDFILPPEAHFHVGSGNAKISHVVLEIHYDNPQHLTNIVDSTGFEAFYVDSPRTYNAAGMTLGDPTASFSKFTGTSVPYDVGALPPATEKIHRQATCPSSCTNDLNSTITVFSGFLHMHNFGEKMYTQHYNSSGALLRTTNRVDFWDNGFQQMRDDNDFTFQIARGDSLQTHCFFNSKQHSSGHIAFGGATADEMCMDFLFYYPAQYRGVDSSNRKQLFAFCGGIAVTSPSNAIHTLCGGLSQTGSTSGIPNFLLAGNQVKEGDEAFADPSNFGNANQNTGGQATTRAECDVAVTTTTPASTTSETLPHLTSSGTASASRVSTATVIALLPCLFFYMM